jgi:hypothetical protein
MFLDHEVCTLLQGLYSGPHSRNPPALIDCSNMFVYLWFIPLCEVCVFAHIAQIHECQRSMQHSGIKDSLNSH